MADKCMIDIYTDDVVHPNFGGVGFHVFHHTHPISKEMFENVVGKRWREMNPSFARMNDRWNWDKETWDKTAKFPRPLLCLWFADQILQRPGHRPIKSLRRFTGCCGENSHEGRNS